MTEHPTDAMNKDEKLPADAMIRAGAKVAAEYGFPKFDHPNGELLLAIHREMEAARRALHPLTKMVQDDERMGLYDDEQVAARTTPIADEWLAFNLSDEAKAELDALRDTMAGPPVNMLVGTTPINSEGLGYWGPDVDGDWIVNAAGTDLAFAVPDETKAHRLAALLKASLPTPVIEEGLRLREALKEARLAIVEAARDTLWCSDKYPAETVVDHIDDALGASNVS